MPYSSPVSTPIALGVTFPLLSISAVAARFWARRKKRMAYKIDDWMLIPALLLSVANAIDMLVAATNGNLGKLMPLGPSGFPIANPDFETFQKCIYANKILTTLAIAVTRHALLLFYNRIFIGRSFNTTVWLLYIVNGTWGLTFTFLFIFSCTPISDTWKAAAGAKGRNCIPLFPIKIYAIASVIIDVAILAIPWPQILPLKMKRREKIAVLGIFGLGGLVLGVAVGKCVEFFNVISKISRDHQITYDEAPTMYWTIPETCIAVVCACLPTLRPIFHGWSPESLVGSIRSAISLHSMGSNRARGTASSGSAFHKSITDGQGSDSVRNLRDDTDNDTEIPALPCKVKGANQNESALEEGRSENSVSFDVAGMTQAKPKLRDEL